MIFGFSLRQFLLVALLLVTFVWTPPCHAELMTRKKALRELGLSGKEASEKEIKAAFRRRSLETHPDKGGSKEAFIRVSEAYEFLSSGKTTKSEDISTDEQVKWAEDLFFDIFDEVLEDLDATTDVIITWMFQNADQKGATAWFLRRLKPLVRSVVRRATKFIQEAMDSEGTTININGKQMSGAEFKQYRQDARERRKREKVGSADAREKIKSDL